MRNFQLTHLRLCNSSNISIDLGVNCDTLWMSMLLMLAADIVLVVIVLVAASNASVSRGFTSSKVSNCSSMARAEACRPPVGDEREEARMMNSRHQTGQMDRRRDCHAVASVCICYTVGIIAALSNGQTSWICLAFSDLIAHCCLSCWQRKKN